MVATQPASRPRPSPGTPRSPGESSSRGADSGAPEVEIDMQTLAERVYALLREELRLERERLGRSDY